MSRNETSRGELERRLDALPREIAPSRDLWPGIAARIGAPASQPRAERAAGRRPGLPVLLALAAGYALAVWLPLPPFVPGPAPSAAPTALDLVADIRPALASLPAKTRAIVEADLVGLEQDWIRIEQALAADPDNALLNELRMSAEDRAAYLRAQLTRLAGSRPVGGLEI